jgi:hypothetical protein
MRVSRLWSQFLKLEKKYECYEFYQECQNDLPILLFLSLLFSMVIVFIKHVYEPEYITGPLGVIPIAVLK